MSCNESATTVVGDKVAGNGSALIAGATARLSSKRKIERCLKYTFANAL
jgi:hypothetical protein